MTNAHSDTTTATVKVHSPVGPRFLHTLFALSPSVLLISLFATGNLCICFFFSPLKFYLCSNITNGSIGNGIFWVWLFGTVHLRFIHYYMFCYFVPFLLLSSVLLNGFTSLFTIFPIEGHLDYLQFWVIMNKTAKYIHAQTCVWAQAFISFG